MTAGGRTAEHWKGGLFYVNAQDPALWVPKRLGIGYTLNFARREAWAVLGLILSIPLVILLLVAVVGPR